MMEINDNNQNEKNDKDNSRIDGMLGQVKKDFPEMVGYIVYEVIIPKGYEMLTDAISMLIYKDRRLGGGSKSFGSSSNNSRIKYDDISTRSINRSRTSRSTVVSSVGPRQIGCSNEIDWKDIVYEYRDDALEVLHRLKQHQKRCGDVSIGFMYDVYNDVVCPKQTLTYHHTYNNWGWILNDKSDLYYTDVVKDRRSGFYYIDFPDIQQIH